MFDIIKKILAPKKCYSCKKEGYFLCKKCAYKLQDYESSCFECKHKSKYHKIHEKCKNNKVYYDKILIKYHYRGEIIAKMIKDAKFYYKKDIFTEYGEDLYMLLQENENINSEMILFPVPLHFLRQIKRGYNQAEVLVKSIHKTSLIGYHNDLISRKKITRQQSKLSRNKRFENIKNSFVMQKKYIDIIDKKEIIIVDDVVSTGSTVNEIARILKENGAKRVIVLCIASD